LIEQRLAAWKQHSLATLIENCKDDEAMSTGGCLYHDIKGLKPRRGDGCALRSAKILALVDLHIIIIVVGCISDII
jgi:hypothetical protein